jgi:hypothetical protein
MEWAEDNDADYIFGLAGNAVLYALVAEIADNLRFHHVMSRKGKLLRCLPINEPTDASGDCCALL